ncbi:hypothetical protein ACHWQZ_G001799 [Mnemiopsis leidyi]
MAEDGPTRRGDPVVDIKGAAFLPYMIMEDIIDKLKLLNYEDEFIARLGQRPISRTYFAVPGSAGEQFFVFSNLLSWLLGICGRRFEAPLEDDDPNAVISNIMSEIRSLGLNTDFPPSRLKAGCGDEVCYILNQLASKALEMKRFTWSRPEYTEEDAQEEAIEDEQLDEQIEDADIDEDYEDEIMLDIGEVNAASQDSIEVQKQEDLLESSTDALEWKMEVERVMPSLKVHLRSDKDWRTHLDQMLENRKNMSTSLAASKTQLDQMHQEITRTLEKITSREKYINSQMEGPIAEYRRLKDRLAEIEEKYRSAGSTVTDQSRTLAQITEELEAIKTQMDEKGTTMTDSGPLVKIKQAITKVKNELVQMELRIGVLQHVVITAKVNDKTNMTRDMNSEDHFTDLKTSF